MTDTGDSKTPDDGLASGSVLAEIVEHLRQTDHNPQASDQEKLQLVWQMYRHAQDDLLASREAEEKTRQAQAEEMKEVESYVEHIRHLSDEREALIQELEAENEALKTERAKVQQNTSAEDVSEDMKKETAEMLCQQGLEDIANATSCEQIAFLLVERAKLLDELELEQTRSETDEKTSKELRQILESERQDFEEELQHVREQEKRSQSSLRHDHEEEIGALMDENSKLEQDLATAKQKMKELESEIDRLTEDLETEHNLRQKEREEREKERKKNAEEKENLLIESPRPRTGLARSASDVSIRKIIEEKTKIEGELIPLRSKIRTLENEHQKKDDELKRMKDDMERGLMIQQQLQMKNKNLRTELEELEQQLDDAETSVEKLSASKEELTSKLTALQEEVKELRGTSQKAETLQNVVDVLKIDKQKLSEKVSQIEHNLEQALNERDKLAAHNNALMKKEEELANQIASLEVSMEESRREQENLSSERKKLLESQEEQTRQLNTLRAELQSLTEDKQSLHNSSETMTKENKELANQIAQLREDSQKSELSHSQELAKQEIIVNHMREQNQKLTGQVSDLQTELSDVRVNENTLLHTQKSLLSSNEELEKKYKTEMDDITAKLQMTLTELTKTRTVLEQEQGEKNSLADKLSTLDGTQEELEQLKSLLEQEQGEKTSLADKLSILDQKQQELEHMKNLLEQERKSKTEVEMKLQEIDLKLIERSMVADGFEDERKQRLELERKVFDLNKLESDLATARGRLEEEHRMRNELESKVQDLEQVLDDQKMDHENLQHSMGNKIKSLENRVRALQEDLFTAQDELQVAQEKYEQTINELESTKTESKLDQQTLSQLKSSPGASTQDQVDSGNKNRDSTNHVQELQSNLQLSNAKLEETFGALQTSSNKVSQLQRDLKSSTSKLEELQQDLEEKEAELEKTRHKLNKVTKSYDDSQASLQEIERSVESMIRERDSAKRQAELLKSSSMSASEERQHHIDKIKVAEGISRQLELDNREMAKKLSETLTKFGQLEDELRTEKQRGTEKHSQNVRYIQQLEADLDVAREQNRQLREELHTHQTQVFKLEADGVGQSAKYESTITRLEMELKEIKVFHKKELDSVSEKMDTTSGDAREMRIQLRDKEQELIQQQITTSRAKSTIERLEAQLATEIKLQTDHENRNLTLDQEMTKVWSQVRSLMEKNANLENKKRDLEEELSRKNASKHQVESIYAQTAASHEATLRSMQTRAEGAESKVTDLSLQPLIVKAERLQRELQDVSVKMHSTEENLIQAESTRQELQDTSDLVVTLRNQLQGEKLHRNLLDQTVAELKHQVSILKQREAKLVEENRDLQHTVLDLESRLGNLQDRNDTAYEMHHQLSEVGKKTLLDQISRLQEEVKQLQYELLTNSEKRGLDEKRYEDRKLRTKEKLLKAREFYSHERSRMNEQMTRLDEDLRLTRATLRKELEWKEKMDINYKQLLHEKRDLITQMTEIEETVRDRSRSLSMATVRTKFLEEENCRLQDRIDMLCQQKLSLDRLIKDRQLGKTETITRSFPSSQYLGDYSRAITRSRSSSIVGSGDWEDTVGDGTVTFRPPLSGGYLNGEYSAGVIRLLGNRDNDNDSEKSAHSNQEYEA